MIKENFVWLLIGVFISAGSQAVLDIIRHITYFIHWDYLQKRRWIKRHYLKAFDIKLDDDIVRDMAYRACKGPKIDEE